MKSTIIPIWINISNNIYFNIRYLTHINKDHPLYNEPYKVFRHVSRREIRSFVISKLTQENY